MRIQPKQIKPEYLTNMDEQFNFFFFLQNIDELFVWNEI